MVGIGILKKRQIVCVNHMQSVFIWRKYGFKRY
nr:MAG TPA: transcription factor/DNA Complex factor Complex Zinc finger.3A [Caudoviricetes sp.]